MRESEKNTDSLVVLDGMFNGADDMPEARSGRKRQKPEIITAKEIPSRWHTVKQTMAGIGITAAVLVTGAAVVSGVEIVFASAPQVHADAEITDGGKAAVKKIDMRIQPITLSTSDIYVSGVKDTFQFDVSLPLMKDFHASFGKTSAETSANAKILIHVDPKDINMEYNPNDNSVEYNVNNDTITTEVVVPADESTTVPLSSGISTIPTAAWTKMAEVIAGFEKDGDASKVPILGKVAAQQYSIADGLGKFAQKDIKKQVAEQCVPLISHVSTFETQIEENINTIARKEISENYLDPKSGDMYKKLHAVPKDKLMVALDEAKVNMPSAENYISTVNPAYANDVKAYTTTKFYATNADSAPKIKCGIDDDVVFIPNTSSNGSKG